ncbi:MAG: hypothetical protein Q9200_003920 [Gallowayella weberi]
MTLWGDLVIGFFLTLLADGLGRRRILMLGAALMTASGLAFILSDNYWVLVAASIIGVISPSGNEIGPFKAIEESTLSQLSPAEIRRDIFAWYILFGNARTACGMILCGWLVEWLQTLNGWSSTRAYRVIFGLYAFLGLLKLGLSMLLSEKCEPEPPKLEYQPPWRKAGSSSHPSAILLKLSVLFSIDSFASSLATSTWLTYFFVMKFSLPEGYLGTLFFTSSIIAALSNLVATSISKRIGLLKTKVVTHLPSAIFLALIPLPSTVFPAMTLLVLRTCTQNMDQAPRQAFLAAAVLPSERTAMMGL